jgi:hypothetical protein
MLSTFWERSLESVKGNCPMLCRWRYKVSQALRRFGFDHTALRFDPRSAIECFFLRLDWRGRLER